MVWWAPLAIAGGMKIADSLFGGNKQQPQQPMTGGSPSLVPIQHEVRQDPGLIPIGQPPPQMPQMPQMPQAPIAQQQGQFFGSFDSPFGDPYAMGGSNQVQPSRYTPNEMAMWVNAGGQVGSLLGNLASKIF